MRTKPSSQRVTARFLKEAAVNPFIPKDILSDVEEFAEKAKQLAAISKRLSKSTYKAAVDLEDQYPKAAQEWAGRGGDPDDFQDSIEGSGMWDALQIAEGLHDDFGKNKSNNMTTKAKAIAQDWDLYLDWLRSGKPPR